MVSLEAYTFPEELRMSLNVSVSRPVTAVTWLGEGSREERLEGTGGGAGSSSGINMSLVYGVGGLTSIDEADIGEISADIISGSSSRGGGARVDP
jgi:hypothetical protein